MVNFIKTLKLRWSDLLLAIGFVCFGVFAIYGQFFMQEQNPANVGLPLSAIIVLFVVGLCSFIGYLFLEHKKGNFKLNFVFLIFVFLALLNVVVIACQPSKIDINVISKTNVLYPVGTVVPVNIVISPIHKTMFAMEMILVCLTIYTSLFVLPKRFTSSKFIQILSWLFLIVVLVFIFASYFIEGKQYYEFAKTLFNSTNLNDLLQYTIKSFAGHRNSFGMVLLLGVIFAIVNHTFNKRKFNFFLMFYFMLTMVFTLSKGSLILGTILILIYIYYRLIVTFKEKKKQNIALISIISTIIVTGLSFVLVAFISKGEYFNKLYIEDFTRTLETRSWIWENTFQTLKNGKWAIGRGFGIINLIIYPMNQINADPVISTHNSFVNLLGEGGPLFLLAYLALLVYTAIVIKKNWKLNKDLLFALTASIIVYFIYGFIETNHYVLYILLFPLFLFNEVETKQKQ